MARTGLWKPLTNRSRTALTPDLLCLHTIVGGAAGTWDYFEAGAGGRGVYSHFLVHGRWSSRDDDGALWQCQDTAYTARANLNGNHRIISVETADNAPARPEDIAPWTTAQEETIVDLMVWAHRVHDIPLVLVPDSKPGRRGVCYHRQGCDPFRVAGGELWSGSYGKSCPTDSRISRLPTLLSRARQIVSGLAPEPAPVPAPAPVPPIVKDKDMYVLVQEAGAAPIYTFHPVAGLQWITDAAPFTGREVLNALRAADLIESTTPLQLNAAQLAMLRAHARRSPVGGSPAVTDEELAAAVRPLVSEDALAAALTRALSDLPDVDLTSDAVQRVAQSTATLVSGTIDPADPAGV